MRTPGCGADAAACIAVELTEPGVLGGVPGVLPGELSGMIPLGASHAECEMPDGASDARRARPELAIVGFAIGCGCGVRLGQVCGGGADSCDVTITGCACMAGCCAGACGVTLMPGIVGRFFGAPCPIMV